MNAAENLRKPAPDAPPGIAPEDGYAHPGWLWLDRIACGDLEQERYFAKAGHVLDDEAKEACLTCPVYRECVIWSYLAGGDGRPMNGGYWALLSPGQRKKMSLAEALAHVEQLRAEHQERKASEVQLELELAQVTPESASSSAA